MNKKTLFLLSACWCGVSVTMAQTTFDFSGRVVDETGKGISEVVVNDGIHFAKTDAQGAWVLTSDTTVSKHVSISTPASCELPQLDGLAEGFYVPAGQIVASQGKHDFVLKKRKRMSDNFYYIAVSDPQVRNAYEMKRWRTETVPDLIGVIDSLRKAREVVGTTLGDLVFDNLTLYDEYKESLKQTGAVFFQCIGNHDFDLHYQDLHNMEAGTPVYGEQAYQLRFGPTDYSYNIGKAHVVTLKNINYVGGTKKGKYVECLTGQQLAWLRKDLSFVPKGSLVIVNMHAACWNKVTNGGNVRNAAELQKVLQDYDVHVFCGHTHFCQNNEVTPRLYEHNIGAACGAWWAGWVNQCGAPNGYMVVDVNGSRLKWHYKGTRRDFGYQFKLYGKGEFSTQSSFVVANVWDWDSACRLTWYQDGKPMGDMEQFTDADETIASQKKKRSQAVLTGHLFRAMPADGTKEIRVELTNRFGETYVQTIAL